MKKREIAYPKTIADFRRLFHSEEACMQYLFSIRWPDGFICTCGGKKCWPRRKGKLFECAICHKSFSPTSGTIMHGSHVSLTNWFQAAYFVSTLTPGISALQLQRQLGLGSYRTAWYILGRLRKAMVNDNREKLNGLIEVDEAYVGGTPKGKRRGFFRDKPHNKSLVMGAVEVRKITTKSGKSKEIAGRIRLNIIKGTDMVSLRPFIVENIKPGSRVRTDGLSGYNSETLAGCRHIRKKNDKSKIFKARILHIHRAFSNLKTWINGTHHGVDSRYLQIYLDEFAFRFNRRNYPMVAFRSLLGISTSKLPTSLDKLKSRYASA